MYNKNLNVIIKMAWLPYVESKAERVRGSFREGGHRSFVACLARYSVDNFVQHQNIIPLPPCCCPHLSEIPHVHLASSPPLSKVGVIFLLPFQSLFISCDF